MGIVGCTSIVEGTASVDSTVAATYRTSVSKSLSASAVTSSSKESQRQQSLTTAAISSSCATFRTTSEDAVTATNNWVDAYNKGGDTAGTAGPAVDSLNHSADAVGGAITDSMPQAMRDTFNSYVGAARSVADAIATHASISVYNARKDQLNTIKGQGIDQCRPFP